MKLLPYVLLNVVLVAAGVFIYDQMQDDTPATAREESAGPADMTDLESRLALVEADRRPLLRAQGPDPRLLERLDALEARVEKLAAGRDLPPAATEEPAPAAKPLWAEPESGGEPTPDEVSRFRTLQKAAMAAERRARDRDRIRKMLAKAGIDLAERQREQLAEAYAAFQPRIGKIWGEAKKLGTSGGSVDWPTVISATTAKIQGEFSEQISSFLAPADADAVAAALYERGR